MILTLFRTANASFSPAQFVAHAHQHLPQTLPLPRRENQNAGQIIVVPAHLLFAEEANDLARPGHGVGVDEQVVQKGGDIVKDGLGVEEQLPEEGQILRVELGVGASAILECGGALEGSTHAPCAPRRRPRVSSSSPWRRFWCPAVGRP